ncbi:response regulator [Allocoleopsis franciscana]|uniref:Response regulator with CheY-like receiver domain and winged-helix DNA-binding domain n=1 Tax=Allocoleopsis franciscana PCC 7113 TaxID=1173027 RepID=K9WBD4_9CYAN|nr:response regulator [Allocoleopsis franciscana]AFZ17548.1 response regulator with CheY-like receiver domain and winged-helix DNA-binding domain [Allocoleopsis franciscana PCC 7113]
MTQTILIVEDNPADILLIQRAFRQADLSHISLQIVRDGDAAVLYLSGEGEYSDRECYPLPMLMLLDLKLPRRSGHEVLEWIRQQPDLKRLPVIMLTSSRETLDVNQSYDLGVNSYLVKPIGFTALVEMLRTLNLYWLMLNEPPEFQYS